MIRRTARTYEAEQGIIPIPLRADLTVRIWGLPIDLTPAEAAKIGAVVTALAEPVSPPSPSAEGPGS